MDWEQKDVKLLGMDVYAMEFWQKLRKEENISKILVKLRNNIYEK